MFAAMSAPAVALLAGLVAGPAVDDTAPIVCDPCEGWNQPQEPFRLFGNAHYVGVKGLSAVLITTPKGSILIDGGLPQSVPLIRRNIEKVGGKLADVKWILISHAHFDHVGGVAALVRESGARVGATPHAAVVLRAGMVGKDDPQWGFGDGMRFPPIRKVVELRGRTRIRLGGVTLTKHEMPGHTPGGTTWTWQSCEGDRCANIVYADSLNAVAAPGFRFLDDPRRVKRFRQTIERVRKLPCDILVPAHPHLANLLEKQAARTPDAQSDPLFDPQACRSYADAAEARLEKRLAEERAEERAEAAPKAAAAAPATKNP